MNDQAAKVIQFPGKQKQMDEPVVSALATTSTSTSQIETPTAETQLRARGGVALGLLAVVLATFAVNRVAAPGAVKRAGHGAREIASVGDTPVRDAAWEKSLAERLAQPGSVRGDAFVGSRPSLGDQMRYALLDNRYAVLRAPGESMVKGLRAHGEPLVFDRAQFLSKYGSLFDNEFVSATFRVTEPRGDLRVETYDLLDARGHVISKARFEIDSAGRVTALNLVRI